jgi:hypothetical protein
VNGGSVRGVFNTGFTRRAGAQEEDHLLGERKREKARHFKRSSLSLAPDGLRAGRLK